MKPRTITLPLDVLEFVVGKAFLLAMKRDLKLPDMRYAMEIDGLLDEAINFPPDCPEEVRVKAKCATMKVIFDAVFKVHVKNFDSATAVIMSKYDYGKLKKSGMMWELHPEFTGDYEKDILGE